jgi:enamine deaminase RidA (YjgF/YER057c/UK114 family)
VIFAPAGALITRSPVLVDFDDDAEQVRTTLSNMRHMVESADSSLERVVRVHVVLADICTWRNGSRAARILPVDPPARTAWSM